MTAPHAPRRPAATSASPLERAAATAPAGTGRGFHCNISRRAVLLVAHAFATLCSILALTECNFMVPSASSSSSSSSSNQTQRDAAVGLFSRSVYDSGSGDKLGCVRYTSHDEFDSLLKAGRGFGVVTALGCLGSFLCAAAILGWRPRRWSSTLWAVGQYTLMAATVAQMFTFCAVGSDHLCPGKDCRLTGVGVLSAINVIVLAVISILYFLEDCPEAPWLDWWEEPTLKAGTRTLPDGSSRVQHAAGHGSSALSLEEMDPDDPYRLTPSFSFTSGESRRSRGTSSLGSLEWHSLRRFRLILLGLFLVSWTLSLVGVQRCTFVLVGPAGASQDHFSGVGLFSRAVYYRGNVIGCIDYPAATRMEFDAPFQAGRIFGTVTALLMTFLSLLLAAQVFSDVALREMWLVVRLLLPCATLSQLLTFLVFRTETCSTNDLIDCAPGQLGVWVILNVLLMTGLSVLMNCVPPPPGPLIRFRGTARDTQLPSTKGAPQPWTGGAAPHPVFRPKAASGSAPQGQHRPPVRHGTPPRRRDECDYDDDHTATDSYYLGCASPTTAASELIMGLPPRPPGEDEAAAELITVSVEFIGNERRTVRTVTHTDGSKTITTTVEEMDFDEDDAVDDDDGDAVDTSTEYDDEVDESRYDPGSSSMSATDAYSEEDDNNAAEANGLLSQTNYSSGSEGDSETGSIPGPADNSCYVSESSSSQEDLEATFESDENVAAATMDSSEIEACLRVNDSYDLD